MEKKCKNCNKIFNARRSVILFCSKECSYKARIMDARNKRFGMLQVLDKPPIREKNKTFFLCKCDCGNIKKIEGWNLRKGITTSCGCKNKLPFGESACRFIFGMYKKQALSRNYCFEITLDQFRDITKKECYYCGDLESNCCNRNKTSRFIKGIQKNYKNANGEYTYNGMDRLNNNIGYTLQNVVPCCKLCNSMKSDKNEKDFLKQIQRIHNYKNLK